MQYVLCLESKTHVILSHAQSLTNAIKSQHYAKYQKSTTISRVQATLMNAIFLQTITQCSACLSVIHKGCSTRRGSIQLAWSWITLGEKQGHFQTLIAFTQTGKLRIELVSRSHEGLVSTFSSVFSHLLETLVEHGSIWTARTYI